MDSKVLADLLFPDVTDTVSDIVSRFPRRSPGQFVTRFAPSPTGFLHLGSLLSALIPWLLAKQEKGIFMLRIEDTDQDRKIDNGISIMSEGLREFGIEPDEGRINETEDRGAYGPYLQSERLPFYHAFLKHLVSLGFAYPCWMTPEEIEGVRESQKVSKQVPGIYGNYALWRNAADEDVLAKVKGGEPYVIRLKSPGKYGNKRLYSDVIRGSVQMQEHFMDTVLLKSDSFPTYHLAHLVDDYLMGTTHVIRAEERLASLPLHVQLFELFGFPTPFYAHLAQLLKLDDGKKRKLSKRKDKEADVKGLLASGFAYQGLLEYLMTIVSPDYEQWQQSHPDDHFSAHQVVLPDLNRSGALVDLLKMEQINREYLARLTNEALYNLCVAWVAATRLERHAIVDRGGDVSTLMSDSDLFAFDRMLQGDREYILAAMSIERHTEKDPKRYIRISDVYDQIKFFDDEFFVHLDYPSVSSVLSSEDISQFLTGYAKVLDLQQDVVARFDHLKGFGGGLGYAATNAQFKEGGYRGKVGDLAMLLRIVLCKAERTPDLFSVMQVMGRERVLRRFEQFLSIV